MDHTLFICIVIVVNTGFLGMLIYSLLNHWSAEIIRILTHRIEQALLKATPLRTGAAGDSLINEIARAKARAVAERTHGPG